MDLDADKDSATRTLVVANQTVGGQPLIDQLKALAEEGPHRFIVISPQSGEGGEQAAERLAHTLDRLESEGLQAIGQVTHPDPYTAIQNALEFYGIDEIVISTFSEMQSGWLRADLVGRVRSSTVQAGPPRGRPRMRPPTPRTGRPGRLMESASVALGGQPGSDEHEHHGPPEANQSSRVDATTLGMLLFIISEIMLFGAFFTAYFFIRVVNGDAVAGARATSCPSSSPASTPPS